MPLGAKSTRRWRVVEEHHAAVDVDIRPRLPSHGFQCVPINARDRPRVKRMIRDTRQIDVQVKQFTKVASHKHVIVQVQERAVYRAAKTGLDESIPEGRGPGRSLNNNPLIKLFREWVPRFAQGGVGILITGCHQRDTRIAQSSRHRGDAGHRAKPVSPLRGHDKYDLPD